MSGGAAFLPSTVPPEMVCGLGMFLVFLCEKKTWLFRVYWGLYYLVVCGLASNILRIPIKP